ncbi:GtrA family protein [Clostridium sp. D53t1_180928_C8]|uniref:GtrA family protein n=1 Tax=Clostridium sp. D53t1_180928_C8 TaxID=2787101 RepID=UPI0018AAFFA2|nr:GtrA family protein [Clostridium sp. D53t1_180928_C8]
MLVKFFDKTFLRFIIVGIINTFFGTSIMFIFYNYFRASYWISSAVNYFFRSMLSYYLNKKFTFENKDTGLRTVFKFIINISICYFMAYGIAKPLIRVLLVSYNKIIQENVAMFVGMGLFVIFNYLA